MPSYPHVIALADVDQSYCRATVCGTDANSGVNDRHNNGWKLGFAAGAGIEHAFTDNWSLKMEYLYVGVPTKFVSSEFNAEQGNEADTFSSESHLLRFGLNYKF